MEASMNRTLETEAKRLGEAPLTLQVLLEQGEIVVPILVRSNAIQEDDKTGVRPALALVVTLLRGGVAKVWVNVVEQSEVAPIVARDMIAGQFRAFHSDAELVATLERGDRHIAVVMLRK